MPRQMKFPKVDKKQPSIKNYITVNININTQPVPVRWATSEPKPVPKPEPVQRYVPMYKEFVHNESETHLKAKEKVAKWINSGEIFIHKDQRALLEFPLFKEYSKCGYCWESWRCGANYVEQKDVPSFRDVQNRHNTSPFAVIDVGVFDKHNMLYGIEICYTNKVSIDKIINCRCNLVELYEVDAETVLKMENPKEFFKFAKKIC